LILASQSSARQSLLHGAHLQFDVHVSHLDEGATKATLLDRDASPAEIAMELARLKALRVSSDYPDALVIGADQTMECDGHLYDKPADIAAARRHLMALSGKTHTLHSAVAIAQRNKVIWHHTAAAHLCMRALSDDQIGAYMAVAGETILTSVGCYRLEDAGARLFEHIDGDYFTILGLPLLAVLAYLRDAGAID
jgi:septum formation protein